MRCFIVSHPTTAASPDPHLWMERSSALLAGLVVAKQQHQQHEEACFLVHFSHLPASFHLSPWSKVVLIPLGSVASSSATDSPFPPSRCSFHVSQQSLPCSKNDSSSSFSSLLDSSVWMPPSSFLHQRGLRGLPLRCSQLLEVRPCQLGHNRREKGKKTLCKVIAWKSRPQRHATAVSQIREIGKQPAGSSCMTYASDFLFARFWLFCCW